METLTANQARQRIASLKLNPNDYGIASWNDGNYQIYANALNVKIGGANNINKILAYPKGSTDPVTKKILNEEQTQQAVASYTKDNAIAEIRKLASDYVDTSWQSTNYTPKGMEVFKANFEAKIKELADKTKNYVSGDEFNSIFSQSANDRNALQLSAFERNNRERGGVLGFLDKATPIVTNIAAGLVTGGLPLGAQLAVTAANSYVQGAKGEDIIRGIVGTIAANQLGPLEAGKTTGVGVIDDFNKAVQAIGNPELQSAIFNAARQGTYATITEQNIAKNMAAGAVAGAIATNIQNKYKDPSLANAAGEYIQAKIAGKSDFEAAAAAFSGYATEEQKANAKKAIAEEAFNLPLEQRKALGYMTRQEVAGLTSGEVGSFSQAPSEIAAKQEFRTMPGEVGENIIQYTDKDGVVTYEKRVIAQTPLGNKVGYTILYDTDTNQFYYEYGTGEGKVLSKSRPSLKTLNASQEILPSSLVGAQTGQRKQGDDFGVSTVRQQEAPLQVDIYGVGGQPIEEIPTISLLRTVRSGQKPLQVDVAGGAGFDRGGGLAPQESVAQREPEEEVSEPQRLITESAEDTPQEEPTGQRQTNNTVLLGLLGGGGRFQNTQRNQRTPDERQAASMQALSQALSVGDPGDALFGSGLGRRRNVWNVESLRLKDELGG
jgi:hypothetical protein